MSKVTMDLSRCVTMSAHTMMMVQDGIDAVNLASAETGRNMWEVMKRDPNDPEITGATPAEYSRLFEENETKVNYRWQDLNGIYRNDWSFQARYPSFEIWAEGQETGFVFTTDSDFRLIGNKMKLVDSGTCYAQIMRSLQYIAKNGFDKFVDMINGPPARPSTPIPPPVSPIHNRANTGGAMLFDEDPQPIVSAGRQNTGGAIPRPVCMCRSREGFTEGWCGVAGGGVPGCEH